MTVEKADVSPEFELLSSRLRLRRLRLSDAAAICAYRSLPEVARYQSWDSYTPADADELIDRQLRVVPNTPGTWLQLALTVKPTGELIGDCGIHFRQDEFQQVEFGITLAPMHQGQGFASEAVSALLDYIFGRLDKHRATALTDADNLAAARLFRGLGFRQEAHYIDHVWFKGAWTSEYRFAMLRHEWRPGGSQPGDES